MPNLYDPITYMPFNCLELSASHSQEYLATELEQVSRSLYLVEPEV